MLSLFAALHGAASVTFSGLCITLLDRVAGRRERMTAPGLVTDVPGDVLRDPPALLGTITPIAGRSLTGTVSRDDSPWFAPDTAE